VRFSIQVPYLIQKSGHYWNGKLEVRPARERAGEREREGKVEEKLEVRCGKRTRLGDDPVGDEQEGRGEDYEIINGEMWR